MQVDSSRAIRAAREVAHAATQLAHEAASLARVYEGYGTARDASFAASAASVRAARAAFDLDERALAPPGQDDDALDGAIRASLASLEAATAAVAATRAALDVAVSIRGSQARLGSSSES